MDGIERKRGDTYPISVVLVDQNGPINLTGATDIALGVSDKSHADAGGGSKLLALTGAIGNAAAGVATFAFSDPNSLVLAPGSYSFDVTFKLGGIVFTTPTFPYLVAGRIAPKPV